MSFDRPANPENWMLTTRASDYDGTINFSISGVPNVRILPQELVSLELTSLGIDDVAAADLRGVSVPDFRRDIQGAERALGARTPADATARAISVSLMDVLVQANEELEVRPDDLRVMSSFALGGNHYHVARSLGVEVKDVRYSLNRLIPLIGSEQPPDAVRRLFTLGKFVVASNVSQQLDVRIVSSRTNPVDFISPFQWEQARPRLAQLGQLVRHYNVGKLPIGPLPIVKGEDFGVPESRPNPAAVLSELEREILILRGDGLSTTEVKQALSITEQKLRQSVTSMLDKLGASNMAHAIGIVAGTSRGRWIRGLNPTEIKIVQSLGQGKQNIEIMADAGIKKESVLTVTIDQLLQKYGATNREHLVRLALRPKGGLLKE